MVERVVDQHLVTKTPKESSPSLSPEILYGLAQGVSSHRPEPYVDKMLALIEESAAKNYEPAKSVYCQLLRAHKGPLPDSCTAEIYARKAISTGYLFTSKQDLRMDLDTGNEKQHPRTWRLLHCQFPISQ